MLPADVVPVYMRVFADLEAVPQSSTLVWIQNKYNTIGCTVAAMRLVSHRSGLVQVQVSALSRLSPAMFVPCVCFCADSVRLYV